MRIMKNKNLRLSEYNAKELEEKIGWIILSKKSLNKIWNNRKDDKVWNRYFKDKKD